MTAGGHMLPFIFSSGGSSLDAASSLDTLGWFHGFYASTALISLSKS